MFTPATLPPAWDPAGPPRDWPFMRPFCEAARLAYEPPDDALPALAHLGLAEPRFIERRSTQAYTALAGADAVIAFRGTERAIGDVLTDLTIIRKTTSHGDLHGGFWDGYDRVHRDVATFAEPVARAGGRAWLTGHSLGGALAVVAAHRLATEAGIAIGGVVTFGQPMVVMPNLAASLYERLHDRYVWLVNGSDVVPKLVQPYVHFGQMIWLHDGRLDREDRVPPVAPGGGRRGFAREGPPPLLASLTEAQLDGLVRELEETAPVDGADTDRRGFRGLGPPARIEDHRMAGYSAMVAALAAQGES